MKGRQRSQRFRAVILAFLVAYSAAAVIALQVYADFSFSDRFVADAGITLATAFFTAFLVVYVAKIFNENTGNSSNNNVIESAIRLASLRVASVDFLETSESWQAVEWRVRQVLRSAGVVRISLDSYTTLHHLHLVDALSPNKERRDIALLVPEIDHRSAMDESPSKYPEVEFLLRATALRDVESDRTPSFTVRSNPRQVDQTIVITENVLILLIACGRRDDKKYLVLEAKGMSALRESYLNTFQEAWSIAQPLGRLGTP